MRYLCTLLYIQIQKISLIGHGSMQLFYHFFSKENDNNVFLAKNLILKKRFVIADWRWQGHQERKLKQK